MSMNSTVCVWVSEVREAGELEQICDAACLALGDKHCGLPHGFIEAQGVYVADANYFQPEAFAALLSAQRENSYPWDWSFTWLGPESRAWRVRSACDDAALT